MPDTPTPSPGERTVADVMSQPVVTAQPAETVAVAAGRMRERRVGSVVVICSSRECVAFSHAFAGAMVHDKVKPREV
jgi:CBS domain-containing protein